MILNPDRRFLAGVRVSTLWAVVTLAFAGIVAPSQATSTSEHLGRSDKLLNQASAHRHAEKSPDARGTTLTRNAVLTREEQRHLLARSGIGVTAEQLLAIQGMTRSEAVAHVVGGLRTTPEQAMPAWVDRPLPHFYRRDSMSPDERQRFNMARDAELAQLRQWWIAEMLSTTSPQTERLVFFWHDLFATSYHGLGNRSRAMARQNRLFRQLGTGSWEALLKAMIRDSALLDYLDNNRNRRTSPNENLARELLELFTLGEGHYTENDVRHAARALTGMSTSDTFDDAFQFHTWNHDRGMKSLFGRRGRFDGDGLIDAILDRPESSRFLVERFWHAFVSDAQAPDAWLNRMARRFRASGHDLSALYSDVLSDEAFWAPANRGAIIKSPLDVVVGTARSLEYPKSHWQSMASTLGKLDMDLFAPPNVAGWSDGAAFVTPGRLLARRQALDALLLDASSNHGSDEGNAMAPSMASMSEMNAGMGVSDGSSDSPRMNGSSTMKPMDQSKDQSMASAGVPAGRVSIRIASEDYGGAARIRLGLHRGTTTLWRSTARPVLHGLDTQRLGRMQDMASLPWHDMGFDVPEAAMHRARSLSIEFLNDAGGEDGDRNVYVEGVRMNGRWMAAAEGQQISDCPPELASQAGNLYCAGTLTIELPDGAPAHQDDDLPAYRASNVSLRWASDSPSKNRQSAVFILDHVVTPAKTFDLISFELVANDNDVIELSLSSFSCLPACIETFDECAWQDDLFPTYRALSFPLAKRATEGPKDDTDTATSQSDAQWCGYDALPEPEKALVTVLWRSVPSLIEMTRDTKRGIQFAEPLAVLRSRLRDHAVSVDDSFWGRTENGSAHRVEAFSVDAGYAPPLPAPSEVIPPPRSADTLEQWVGVLERRDLLLEDVLLSGVDLDGFESLSHASASSVERQLRDVLAHPVFQVK